MIIGLKEHVGCFQSTFEPRRRSTRAAQIPVKAFHPSIAPSAESLIIPSGGLKELIGWCQRRRRKRLAPESCSSLHRFTQCRHRKPGSLHPTTIVPTTIAPKIQRHVPPSDTVIKLPLKERSPCWPWNTLLHSITVWLGACADTTTKTLERCLLLVPEPRSSEPLATHQQQASVC